MSKARQLADLGNAYDDGALSNRNLIINGACTVAQRSSSVTGVTGGGYHATDRFNLSISSLGTWTIEASTDAPDGFSNSHKITCTTAKASPAAGNFVFIDYRIEGHDLQQLKKGTASALPVTLSFWVKSNKTGTYIAEFDDNDNSRNINLSYTVNSSGVWEYKTITFDGDTSGSLDNDSSFSARILWWLAAGSDFTSGTLATSWQSSVNANRAVGNVNLADTTSNYFQITGVQLEVGDTATPFEHRSYGDELARCQRYFQTWGSVQTFASGVWFANNQVLAHMPYHKEMRASPTFTTSGSTFAKVYRGGSAIQVSDSSPFDIINTTSARANLSFSTTGTSGHGAMCQTESSAYIHADAEL